MSLEERSYQRLTGYKKVKLMNPDCYLDANVYKFISKQE